jgi:hypothetical protein
LLQVLGHLGGGDRAFADCGGDAFDRAVADIAGGEYAGQAGFEREWRSLQWPAGRWASGAGEVASGDHEAVLVSADLGREPAGVWHGTDQHN